MSYMFYESDVYSDVTGLTSLALTTTGTLTYVMKVDDTFYWHDTTWKESSITAATSNDLTTLNSNIATLPINDINGSDVQVIIIEDYTTTPEGLTDLKLTYTDVQDEMNSLGVNVVVDIRGNKENIKVSAVLDNYTGQNPKYMNEFIDPVTIEKYTDSDGKATLELAPNDLITPSGTYWTIQVGSGTSKNYEIDSGVYEVDLDTLTPLS